MASCSETYKKFWTAASVLKVCMPPPPQMRHGAPHKVCFAATSRITSQLRDQTKQYKWNATKMNKLAWLRRMAPAAIALIILLAVLYWRFFM